MLAEANKVLADENATQEEVETAVELLQKAINQLEKKPVITPTPDPESGEGTGNGNTGNSGNSHTPNTGDTANTATFLLMLIVAGGLLAFLNKQKLIQFISKK